MGVTNIYPSTQGNESTTTVPTGQRKRIRKLKADCVPDRSPTEGVLVWPSEYAVELALAEFGYGWYPTVPYWIDDYGFKDEFSLMEEVRITQVPDDPAHWDITISFSPWQLDNNNVNPLLQTPTCNWSYEKQSIPALFDANGNYICNSAGDPYIPGLTINFGIAICQFARYESTFNPLYAAQYYMQTNADIFNGASPNTCLIRDIRAEYVRMIWGTFYHIQYEFAFRFASDNLGNQIGWTDLVVDAGLSYINGSGYRVPILYGDGSPVTEPYVLNGSGGLGTPGSPIYNQVQTYFSTPFSPLNITFPT